ncbi:MAG: serine protease, partial [Planctomycetota bacterium]
MFQRTSERTRVHYPVFLTSTTRDMMMSDTNSRQLTIAKRSDTSKRSILTAKQALRHLEKHPTDRTYIYYDEEQEIWFPLQRLRHGASPTEFLPVTPNSQRSSLPWAVFLCASLILGLGIPASLFALRSSKAEPPAIGAEHVVKVAIDPKASAEPAKVVAEPLTPVAPTPKHFTSEEIFERNAPSVAHIRGRWSSGTGFLVAENLLATNSHVIDGEYSSNISIGFPSGNQPGKKYQVLHIVEEDRERDIAFIQLENCREKPLALAESIDFKPGRAITIIGNPGIGGNTLINTVTAGVLGTPI